MIAKRHRFHGLHALDTAYRKGRQIKGSLISLRFYMNGSRSTYRAAVVVSTKVSHSAVVRNRIRRRIFEVLRSYDHVIRPESEIIITVYSDTLAEMPADELHALVDSLLRQSDTLIEK